MAVVNEEKRSRKECDNGGEKIAKRRKHTEVRMVGGRVYDPQNGKTCHQCRQKTMDFVAACKNQKDKPCTIKFCHKCLFNRYGEKAEDMAVLDDWNCPKCRGICNCSFCMKKRGHQPTGILVHTARATGFSSVSELLHVNGSENVGSAKSAKGTDMRPTKHTATSNDRVALSPLKQDENMLSEKPKKTKQRPSDENQDGKKAKNGNSKELLDSKNDDVHEEVSKKELKRSQAVGDLEQVKKLKKDAISATELPKEKVTAYLETVEKKANHIELQSKDAISATELPKGSELTTIAGVELKPEDVGHALQFLEFCATFGKVLNLKKGEPEYVLRELITGGRARRGKPSAVYQFHIQLVSLLQEELGESSTLTESTNGRTSWLQALKDCAFECALENLKLAEFGEGSDNYDNFSSSEKLVLLNFICDELLCTEKLRNWIAEQNTKHIEKVKEAKERVVAAKQKEKHLKQKMQDDLAKAIISRNGAPLSISEHDAIVSKIKKESALAHAELLEAKGIVPDEKQRSEAVRVHPIICDADGHIYWRLKGVPNEPNILLQDVGSCDAVGSGEKWFKYTDEEEKEIHKYISALRTDRKRSLCSQASGKPSFRARTAHPIE